MEEMSSFHRSALLGAIGALARWYLHMDIFAPRSNGPLGTLGCLQDNAT
jgi:fluoride ion exporter CrcB/FEX